jgi:protocatechuate 3,4-dioxygenase beta subunit
MSFHDSIPARAAIALVLAITLSITLVACGANDAPSSAVDDLGSAGAPDTTTLALEDEAGAPDAASDAGDTAPSSAAEDGPLSDAGSQEAESDAGATGTEAESPRPTGTSSDGDASPAVALDDEAGAVPPPPACDDLSPTPSDSEGPYYTPDTPMQSILFEPEDEGTPLLVSGYVVDIDCTPQPGAKLDIWQTDPAGDYDNEGYRFRGHLFTDDNGFYGFLTMLPGTYPGRPRHIHLRVHAPGEAEPTLTSQLYFRLPDGTDDTAGVDPALVVDLAEEPQGEGLAGRFDFVLEAE